MNQNLVDRSFQTADIAASYICRNNLSIACSPFENQNKHRTVVCLMISKAVSDGVDERFERKDENKLYRPLSSSRNQSINLKDYAVKPHKK
jgi:hypothetical protein